MWKKLKWIFIIWVSKFIARIHWYSFAISQYLSMQMDRRRYWIHPRILKYAWKWKSKTCFNTPDGWSNFATNDYRIIYDAILIALTRRGFLYLALPITPCALTFPSLETSCKPLRRRECPRGHRILHRSPSPLFFCVSAIRHDSSLSKYRKQKQSPPWTCVILSISRGGLLLFTVLAEWRIMTNRAYAKNKGDGLLCSILWRGATMVSPGLNFEIWVPQIARKLPFRGFSSTFFEAQTLCVHAIKIWNVSVAPPSQTAKITLLRLKSLPVFCLFLICDWDTHFQDFSRLKKMHWTLQSRSPSLRSLGRKRRLWDNPFQGGIWLAVEMNA